MVTKLCGPMAGWNSCESIDLAVGAVWARAIPGAIRPNESDDRKVKRASGRRLDVIRVPERGRPIEKGALRICLDGVGSLFLLLRQALLLLRQPLLGQLELVLVGDVRGHGLAVAGAGGRELELPEGVARQLVEPVPGALGDRHTSD